MRYCASGAGPAAMPRRDALGEIRRVDRLLGRLRIPHALIGGWAAAAWGAARATRDLDLLVLADRDGKQRIQQSFQRLGYGLDWRRGGPEDPIPELLRLTPSRAEGLDVDFLFAFSGFDRDALGRAIRVSLGPWKLPVLRPEDLVAMKLRAGGAVDFADAKEILAVQGTRLEERLLADSCRRLKVSSVLARLRTQRA